MKNILLYIAITACLVFTGCSDLNIDNPNAPTTDSFWKTGEDAVKGVNATYSTLHRGAISRWMPFFFIIRSDEGRSQSPATDIVNNMDQFLITDYNYGNAYDVWKDNFIGINRANQVIYYVPDIDMDETLKARCIAEAKFMRALFYYHLVSMWGNVPLITTVLSPTDLPASSTETEVWAQIVKDLDEASVDLPTSYPNAELGRATKGAAYALMAKAYMQQGNYTAALTPLQWLVEGEGKNIYDLMPDYRDNFLITSENNKESVFEWQFQENPNDNHDDDTDPRVDYLNYGSSLPQFFGPSGVGWSDGEACRWVVHEFLKERSVDDERDSRLAASYLYDSTDERGPDFSMIYGQTFTQRFGGDNTRVWFRKFQNDGWKDFEGYRSPNNWRYIRYADVLLMYAECLNATGKTSDAYQYVDRVRTRPSVNLAKLSDVMPGLSKEDFLTQLKHERILELSGEGHRFNDLKRWGDLGPDLKNRDPGFANFIVGKHELIPIPQLERDLNTNLGQNPEW